MLSRNVINKVESLTGEILDFLTAMSMFVNRSILSSQCQSMLGLSLRRCLTNSLVLLTRKTRTGGVVKKRRKVNWGILSSWSSFARYQLYPWSTKSTQLVLAGHLLLHHYLFIHLFWENEKSSPLQLELFTSSRHFPPPVALHCLLLTIAKVNCLGLCCWCWCWSRCWYCYWCWCWYFPLRASHHCQGELS